MKPYEYKKKVRGFQFMIKEKDNNRIWFGDFHDLDEGKNEFDLFKKFKNKISKNDILNHIKKLKYTISGNETEVYDIFSNEKICIAGHYMDSNFMIAREFPYYFKNYDIGIPYEYEEYLINECGLKPKEN